MNKTLQSYLQNNYILSISPEEIDTSGTWLFWKEEPEDIFCKQIESIGQLMPVLVVSEQGKWLLVAGHKRVRACQIIKCPVLALQVKASDWKKGILYIQSNSERQIEEKMALAALRYFQQIASEKNWFEQILAELHLPLKGGLARGLSNWLQLPLSWDRHVYAGRIDLSCAFLLARFTKLELDVLDQFFESLAWSRNKARNFLTWLFESSKRKKENLHHWLPQTKVHEILDLDLSPKDKIAKLLEIARTQRFPHLVELEEKASFLTKHLSRKTRWDIQVDPSFEQNHTCLTVNVKNRNELELAISELKKLSLADKWEEIWTLAESKET